MATQSKVEFVLRKSFEKVRIVFSTGSEVMAEMSESSLNKSGFVVFPPHQLLTQIQVKVKRVQKM